MEELHAFTAIESARQAKVFEERGTEAWTSRPISLAVVQLNFCSVIGLLRLEPSACSGITIGTYIHTSNSAFDSTVPHLSSLRCRLYTLPFRVALRGLLIRFSGVFVMLTMFIM